MLSAHSRTQPRAQVRHMVASRDEYRRLTPHREIQGEYGIDHVNLADYVICHANDTANDMPDHIQTIIQIAARQVQRLIGENNKTFENLELKATQADARAARHEAFVLAEKAKAEGRPLMHSHNKSKPQKSSTSEKSAEPVVDAAEKARVFIDNTPANVAAILRRGSLMENPTAEDASKFIGFLQENRFAFLNPVSLELMIQDVTDEMITRALLPEKDEQKATRKANPQRDIIRNLHIKAVGILGWDNAGKNAFTVTMQRKVAERSMKNAEKDGEAFLQREVDVAEKALIDAKAPFEKALLDAKARLSNYTLTNSWNASSRKRIALYEKDNDCIFVPTSHSHSADITAEAADITAGAAAKSSDDEEFEFTLRGPSAD